MMEVEVGSRGALMERGSIFGLVSWKRGGPACRQVCREGAMGVAVTGYDLFDQRDCRPPA